MKSMGAGMLHADNIALPDRAQSGFSGKLRPPLFGASLVLHGLIIASLLVLWDRIDPPRPTAVVAVELVYAAGQPVAARPDPPEPEAVERVETEIVKQEVEATVLAEASIIPRPQRKPKLRPVQKIPVSNAGHGGAALQTLPQHVGAGLSNAPPHYPYNAQRQSQQGQVVLRVQVSAVGEVARLSVLRSSGYRLLDDAAVKAVRGWRFTPASRGNSQVAAALDVPISFKLTD